MSQQMDFEGLATGRLRSFRVDRYYGAEHCIDFADLHEADQQHVRALYGGVQEVYATWLEVDQDDAHPELAMRVQHLQEARFLAAVKEIGNQVRGIDSPVARVIHDIRGGALTGILGFIQLAGLQGDSARTASLRRVIIMCRDHAKIMRNLVRDLDPVARSADEDERLHDIDGFVSTWSGVELDLDSRSVHVDVTCNFQGYVTNRCLETSSVDRVLYNLINNAARFSADNRVHLHVLPIDEQHIRWVVTNAVDAGQKLWLMEAADGDLGALYRGGLTRGGHGIGLSNCAEIVAASYGVHPDEAIQEGYLGAKLLDHEFCAWFHWPVFVP